MAQTMGQSAARFTKRYTDTQKNALCKAVYLDGMGKREAMRAAETGQLGIPAFGVPGNAYWGYQILKNHRDTFEAENEDAIERGVADALKAANMANLRALRELPAGADPAERARLAKALADSDKAYKAQKPRAMTPRKRDRDDLEVGKHETTGTLAELLKMAENDESPHKAGSQDGAAAA